MKFPPIERTTRYREYNSYHLFLRAKVVYSYLFEGLSNRALDKEILGLNPEKSKGWQSMGILHFLGLKNSHKNIFNGVDIDSAIECLLQIKTEDALLIAKHIRNSKATLDKGRFEEEFYEHVNKSLKGDKKIREKRLNNYKDDVPQKTEVVSFSFKRNPDVAAHVLERANGICEACKQKAPFLRAKDNTPYLEIHHIIRLADGGKDNIKNAIALCPNCHRKVHFGKSDNIF